jgi:hypothetical protein
LKSLETADDVCLTEPEIFVITVAEQDRAIQELTTERELRGETMPDHIAKDEPFTSCPRCTIVARRALSIALTRDAPAN